MKKALSSALVLLALLAAHQAMAQTRAAELQTVTLYSPMYARLRRERPRPHVCFNFATGQLVERGSRWDICYGYMYLGHDLDWFEVLPSTAESRNVIRDLGRHNWNDAFKVSALQPLPKLKEWMRRQVIIDTSGRNGADGRAGTNGTNGVAGMNGVNGSGVAPPQPDATIDEFELPQRDPLIQPDLALPLETVKNPAQPKKFNLPIFAQGALNHIYELHVVNAQADYYVLFRVDALSSGDNCTISWRRVSAPR